MVKLDNNHWQEVITSVINAIGADAFLRLSAAVLEEHVMNILGDELRGIADEYTRGVEEWPTTGKEKDEWKHEAVEAMKLKR